MFTFIFKFYGFVLTVWVVVILLTDCTTTIEPNKCNEVTRINYCADSDVYPGRWGNPCRYDTMAECLGIIRQLEDPFGFCTENKTTREICQ